VSREALSGSIKALAFMFYLLFHLIAALLAGAQLHMACAARALVESGKRRDCSHRNVALRACRRCPDAPLSAAADGSCRRR
jgi:hypothetical protein